jgi:uncharacterized membrane protein YGL010W
MWLLVDLLIVLIPSRFATLRAALFALMVQIGFCNLELSWTFVTVVIMSIVSPYECMEALATQSSRHYERLVS